MRVPLPPPKRISSEPRPASLKGQGAAADACATNKGPAEALHSPRRPCPRVPREAHWQAHFTHAHTGGHSGWAPAAACNLTYTVCSLSDAVPKMRCATDGLHPLPYAMRSRSQALPNPASKAICTHRTQEQMTAGAAIHTSTRILQAGRGRISVVSSGTQHASHTEVVCAVACVRVHTHQGHPSLLTLGLQLLLVAEHGLVLVPPLLLLPRRLPPPEILDLFAPRHWAVRARAALGVQVQEEPHLLAQGAAASDLLLAAHGMLEQLAHLAAGAGLALQVVAAARMHQQRHRLLQLLAALPPLRIREPHACLVVVAAGLGHEGVLVAARVLAVGADVKVVALVAVPARAWLHVNVTQVAAAGKGGGVGVVGVVQDHHGAVLRAPQCVKLVVVALAQVQEGLPRLEVLVLHILAGVHAHGHIPHHLAVQ
mmetsp:Transcript_16910/g.46683  ORF Transcript_16910/g.46683 Transcript_16910/m.46683 type:complete len:427 (-) Transcript_16910:4165-5445(-)